MKFALRKPMPKRQTVAIAYSERAARHVLVFVSEKEGVEYCKHSAALGADDAKQPIERLLQGETLYDLLLSAEDYGNMFGYSNSGAEHHFKSAFDSDYPFNVKSLTETASTKLAREVFSTCTPTRNQLRMTRKALDAFGCTVKSADGQEAVRVDLDHYRRQSPLKNDNVCVEPLSDWLAFRELASDFVRMANMFAAPEGERELAAEKVPKGIRLGCETFRLSTTLDPDGAYAALLREYNKGFTARKGDRPLLVEHPDSALSIEAEWFRHEYQEREMSETRGIDQLMSLHLQGMRPRYKFPHVHIEPDSAAALVYQEMAELLDKELLKMCANIGCRNIFVAKRQDAYRCSPNCKGTPWKKAASVAGVKE